ncbi:MAG: hypothetical protein FH761_02050 [Firmicutes bacterium]|nr:hypothetical protein [Bacillota bacterium]
MKVWEWYFLVVMATALLIITFFTKNIYVAIGTFALALYLKRHSENIPLPKQFNKFKIMSKKTDKIIEVDERHK